MTIEFQRTLRIPDDDSDYALPPGLGRFPLRHIDDHADRVPGEWLKRGGVMLPMYQSEALWLSFSSPNEYPFAVKVGTGRINALTGTPWTDKLARRPQDYLSIPEQPWLDGYCVAKGIVRQFVAMPLGSGYSVEEQLTGSAEHGGMQLLIHPLRKEAYSPAAPDCDMDVVMCESAMGYAPGGRMEQEIYDDPYKFSDWDMQHHSRCFIHAVNSLMWRAITGDDPPTTPVTSAEYASAGLPWFEYYDADNTAMSGGTGLRKIRSITEIAKQKGDVALPENESVTPKHIVKLRRGLGRHEVREGTF